VVQLQASERKLLQRLVRTPTAQYRQVLRAKIVLAAAAGLTNARIARRLGITVNTVRKWRKRYAAQGLAGLADRKRCGRPRVYPAVVVAQAKAIACELPATRGVPLSRWSVGEVRAELLASGITPDVSVATVGRWLAADAIRPWRYRSWIFPRDPEFAAKAAVVLGPVRAGL
jgi:transposase